MYRLYTEDGTKYDPTYRANIENILAKYVDGYTLIETIGSYRHKREPSLIIELMLTEENRHLAQVIAKEICLQNNQESVMIQRIDDHIKFMGKDSPVILIQE